MSCLIANWNRPASYIINARITMAAGGIPFLNQSRTPEALKRKARNLRQQASLAGFVMDNLPEANDFENL
jgi:hypothetical protein